MQTSEFHGMTRRETQNRTVRNTIPWPCTRKDEDAPGTHNSEGYITYYYRTPIALENNMPCLAPTTSRTSNVSARCRNKFHHGQSSHENLRTLSHTLKWYNGTFWNREISLTKMIHSLNDTSGVCGRKKQTHSLKWCTILVCGDCTPAQKALVCRDYYRYLLQNHTF